MSINALHLCIHRTSQSHSVASCIRQELDRATTHLNDAKQLAAERHKVIKRLEEKLAAAKKENKDAKKEKKEAKQEKKQQDVFQFSSIQFRTPNFLFRNKHLNISTSQSCALPSIMQWTEDLGQEQVKDLRAELEKAKAMRCDQMNEERIIPDHIISYHIRSYQMFHSNAHLFFFLLLSSSCFNLHAPRRCKTSTPMPLAHSRHSIQNCSMRRSFASPTWRSFFLTQQQGSGHLRTSADQVYSGTCFPKSRHSRFAPGQHFMTFHSCLALIISRPRQAIRFAHIEPVAGPHEAKRSRD